MFDLPQKTKKLVPYSPNKQTYDIMLNSNESFIDVADELKIKLGKTFSKTVFNRYPDPECDRLRKSYADYAGVFPEQVCAGNGSDELIWVILSAFLEKGKKILQFTPDFSMYEFYASLCELEVCSFPRAEGLSDITQVIDTINNQVPQSDISLIIFSNPGNPTSVVLAREKVLKLVDSVKCLVVVDEAYMDFSDQSVLHDTKTRDNLIVLRTCSKAIGIAGLRVGFAVSNCAIAEKISAASSPYDVSVLTQALAADILDEKEFVAQSISRVISSRKHLQDGLNKLAASVNQQLKVYPSSANFIYIEMENETAIYVFEELKKRSILVRAFPSALRITCGTEQENAIVINTLAEIFAGDVHPAMYNFIGNPTQINTLLPFLRSGLPRTSQVTRKTKETEIVLALNLDGGNCSIHTGIGFFDHMLTALAMHSGMGLVLNVKGDLEVDAHHTVEDTGIALGQAIKKALSDVAISRYGTAFIPMDESLAMCSMDICGRSFLVYQAEFQNPSVGEFDCCLAKEFFYALANNAGITLHLQLQYGANDHHKLESLFKATAHALKQAIAPRKELLSTKGEISL